MDINVSRLEGAKMPVAVITQTSDKFDLKSLPGAYVVIKRMTYGQRLVRQQMALRMQMKGTGSKKDQIIDLEMMNRITSLWSFANLIDDHNLTDEAERKLNFQNPADVERLTAVVGEEIDKLIDKVNNFEDDVDEEEEGTLGN
jgi:hypothetical protein